MLLLCVHIMDDSFTADHLIQVGQTRLGYLFPELV